MKIPLEKFTMDLECNQSYASDRNGGLYAPFLFVDLVIC